MSINILGTWVNYYFLNICAYFYVTNCIYLFFQVKTDTVIILCRKKAENTRWDYLTQVEKECKEKE